MYGCRMTLLLLRHVRRHLHRSCAGMPTGPDLPLATVHNQLSYMCYPSYLKSPASAHPPSLIRPSAELHDFVVEDLLRMYPHAAADVTITVIEGKQILGGFDASLREYTERKFRRDKIRLRTGANVTHLGPTTAQLSDGDKLDFGVCIWNTGIAPNVRWDGGMFRTDKWGHIVVNEYMKALKPADTSQQAGAVQHAKSPASENTPPTAATDDVFTSDQPGTQVPCIWAVGDAAAVGTTAYAATAQVAEQQGTWLAHALNEAARVAPAGTRAAAGASAGGAAPPPPPRTPSGAALSIEDRVAAIAAYTPREPFRYQHRGSLAFIGTFAAVSDFTKAALPIHGARVKGIAAWLVWRSAYLTKLGSWRNRVQVPLDWTRTLLFGRDTTQF